LVVEGRLQEGINTAVHSEPLGGAVAFIFSGQGSQTPGMGKELAGAFSAAARVLQMADEVLGFPLSRLCFEGPAEELTRTENAQPAIVAVSLAALAAFREICKVAPRLTAGHSLGEYSALAAAGALAETEAVRLVRLRGLFMAEAASAAPGTMAAVIGLPAEEVERLCAEDGGVVVAANFNTPEQTVISGEPEAVARVGAAARERGAKRVVPLAVSGAFHSPLMAPAAEKMRAVLQDAAVGTPSIPVVPNVTGEPTSDPEEIKKLLAAQITSPVQWVKSVNRMWECGVRTFVEFGPGQVLSGMVKRIQPSAVALSVSDAKSLEEAASALGG
jgi:[acyl-carrier-protein] S-malonyltransferase